MFGIVFYIKFRSSFLTSFWEPFSLILEVILVIFWSSEALAGKKSAFTENLKFLKETNEFRGSEAPRGGRKHKFFTVFSEVVFGVRFLECFWSDVGVVLGSILHYFPHCFWTSFFGCVRVVNARGVLC